MRSLTLTEASIASTSNIIPEGSIGAVAVDPEDGTLYVAHERSGEEGGVEVEVLAMKAGPGGTHDGEVSSVTPIYLPSVRRDRRLS